jgi:soluble lytic murein transglycosylase-like protein
MPRSTAFVLLTLAALALPAPARAELVRLTSGQVLSVKAYRVEGDTAVLTLRSGGEMRTEVSTVSEVLPDEVPHPDPPDPNAVVVAPTVAPAMEARIAGDAIHTLVDRLAVQFGVDPKLANAVVEVESNFQPRAVSSQGAMGLMQLMPMVAKEYALTDPFDPEQNVAAGLRHLRDLLDRFDTSIALAAYNAGEGTVSRYGGKIPPYPETRDYVQRVLALTRRP